MEKQDIIAIAGAAGMLIILAYVFYSAIQSYFLPGVIGFIIGLIAYIAIEVTYPIENKIIEALLAFGIGIIGAWFSAFVLAHLVATIIISVLALIGIALLLYFFGAEIGIIGSAIAGLISIFRR